MANIYNVNVMLRSDSTEQLQSMILSRNKIYSWKPCFTVWASSLENLSSGVPIDQVRQNWPAQSQNPRVLAYSNLSNHTFQVANNKSVDQTARLICTFIVRTCSLQVAPGVFSRRGSQNTKLGYIVPSDYLTELKYEKIKYESRRNKKDHSDGQTFSVPAQHLSRSRTLVLWLNVLMTYSLGEQTAKVLARLRVCAGSPEPSLFAYAINGNGEH